MTRRAGRGLRSSGQRRSSERSGAAWQGWRSMAERGEEWHGKVLAAIDCGVLPMPISANQKLDKAASLTAGWNGYSAPAPTPIAVASAREFLFVLHESDVEPSRIAASAVGGIGITIRNDGRKAYVEFYNDGRIHALFAKGRSEPDVVRPVRPTHIEFKNLTDDIREYLDGRDTLPVDPAGGYP